MKKIAILLFVFLLTILFFPNRSNQNRNWIAIDWVNEIGGDFSFKNQWSYPEGVYLNRFGQLSCDGDCPPEIDRMKDDKGRIYTDSLQAFYQKVDTTHIYHSIKSKASAYEYSGTKFIKFEKKPDNSIFGKTMFNVGTHSSLNIKIKNDSVTAWIEYNGTTDPRKYIFPLKEGQIKIEKLNFNKEIIKAKFNLEFVNTLNENEKMYWIGLIYSEI